MECIDQELQQRVWQRVQRTGVTAQPGTEGLLLEEREEAVLLRHLGHKQLAAQAEQRAVILQGICRLSGIPDATILPKADKTANDTAARRRIMAALLRRVRQYEALSDDQFGPIYASLARLAEKSCVLLATYVGSTPLRNRE